MKVMMILNGDILHFRYLYEAGGQLLLNKSAYVKIRESGKLEQIVNKRLMQVWNGASFLFTTQLSMKAVLP